MAPEPPCGQDNSSHHSALQAADPFRLALELLAMLASPTTCLGGDGAAAFGVQRDPGALLLLLLPAVHAVAVAQAAALIKRPGGAAEGLTLQELRRREPDVQPSAGARYVAAALAGGAMGRRWTN